MRFLYKVLQLHKYIYSYRISHYTSKIWTSKQKPTLIYMQESHSFVSWHFISFLKHKYYTSLLGTTCTYMQLLSLTSQWHQRKCLFNFIPIAHSNCIQIISVTLHHGANVVKRNLSSSCSRYPLSMRHLSFWHSLYALSKFEAQSDK